MALLPSLSAAPFMAREILQTNDKIEIIKPQIITPALLTGDAITDWRSWSVHFIYQEQVIGKGLLTSLSFNSGMENILSSPESPYETYVPGLQSIDFSGVLSGALRR